MSVKIGENMTNYGVMSMMFAVPAEMRNTVIDMDVKNGALNVGMV